jgi:hypothetical protein
MESNKKTNRSRFRKNSDMQPLISEETPVSDSTNLHKFEQCEIRTGNEKQLNLEEELKVRECKTKEGSKVVENISDFGDSKAKQDEMMALKRQMNAIAEREGDELAREILKDRDYFGD